MAFLLAKKLKMSQIWKDNKVIPVTVIRVEPNKVTKVLTKEKEGYSAIQVSMGEKKKEFRSKGRVAFDIEKFKVGDTVAVDVFNEGDTVLVAGTSKGKGFQGVVKRHGFHGGPKTHGQKNRFRAPGSIGSTAPQRGFPGRKMAGHMGNERVTIIGLKVVGVNKDENEILLKGAVPGARGGIVEVAKIRSTKS